MTTNLDTNAYRRIFLPLSRTKQGFGKLRQPLRLGQFVLNGFAAALLTGVAASVIRANLFAAYWQIPLISFLIPALLFCLLFMLLLPLHTKFCYILLTEDSLIHYTYGRTKKINLTFGKPKVTLQENGLVAFSTTDEKITVNLNEKGGYEFFTILKTKFGIVFPSRVYEHFDIARHRAESGAKPPKGANPYEPERPDDED